MILEEIDQVLNTKVTRPYYEYVVHMPSSIHNGLMEHMLLPRFCQAGKAYT